MNVEEFENIAPKLRKEELYSSQREIIRQLKHMANQICRGSISPEYINKAFNKFKHGYVYYDENGTTAGFCIWSLKIESYKLEQEYNVLYIHLICGRHMPQYICNRIFPDIELFCKQHDIDAIQLEPANDFLQQYYESYGFELTDTLFHKMSKRISYTLSHTTRGKTRKHKKVPMLRTNAP